MKPYSTLFAAAALITSAGLAPAEPARSLNDARSQINSGTWPGITLIEAKPKTTKVEPPVSAASAVPPSAAPVSAAPAPAPAVAATAGTGAKATPATSASPVSQATAPAAPAVPPAATAPGPAAPAAPVAATPKAAPPAAANSPSTADRLRALFGPPSGLPMNEAKRLDSPSVGIVLPTSSASAASGAGK